MRMTVAPKLGRDITAALAFKLALLTLLYVLFFSADTRPVIDAQRAAQHILSPTSDSETPR